MEHRLLARCLLTAFSAIQGIATIAIDLNKTHATHPAWPGHARFHLVWQVASSVLLAILVSLLLWYPGIPAAPSFYMAIALTCISLVGFLIALSAMRLYQGALSDQNGIPPITIPLRGTSLHLDGNLLAVLLALFAVCVVFLLYRH